MQELEDSWCTEERVHYIDLLYTRFFPNSLYKEVDGLFFRLRRNSSREVEDKSSVIPHATTNLTNLINQLFFVAKQKDWIEVSLEGNRTGDEGTYKGKINRFIARECGSRWQIQRCGFCVSPVDDSRAWRQSPDDTEEWLNRESVEEGMGEQ